LLSFKIVVAELALLKVMKNGFDTKKYLKAQTSAILERVKKFRRKLYLEFGGKLCYDFHASRVLPGYDPNTKILLLQQLKDKIEIIFCVSAKDIEQGKIRGDFNLSYESMTIKTINDLRSFALRVNAVIINRFSGEKQALKLKRYLENQKIKTYLQAEIQGYPADIEKILSREGYGKNPYIKTGKPIVIVAGAGPGSGKMSTCLSQIYHDSKQNKKSGFAKFETFPIWNLPLEHPVNFAYEAATADIGDKNMIDPYHLKAYNKTAINYNRDIENFAIMKKIIEEVSDITYKSPTDMGVSMTKKGIIDETIVKEAAKQEIIRRYFRYKREFLLGITEKETIGRVEKIMQRLNLKEGDRKVVQEARKAAAESKKRAIRKKDKINFYCGAALQIDGIIEKGKNSSLLHAESAAIINLIKKLSKIPKKIDLLPKQIIQNIAEMKGNLREKTTSLNVEETLVALAISSTMNPAAALCIKNLPKLNGADMHTTHMPSQGDEGGIRELGINLTTDALMLFNELYFR